jgi:lipopolysaccharide transport system permease protein
VSTELVTPSHTLPRVALLEDTLLLRAFRYRWLIYTLVARDLKLRYSGSALGVLWTLLNPLLLMSVYTLVFSVYFHVALEKYPVFLLSGLLPWIWFAESIQFGTMSVVMGGMYIGHTVFPADMLPIVSVFSTMMNYVFSIPLLFLLIFLLHVPVGWSLLALPAILLAQFMLSTGIVFFTATYTVFFRDLSYLITHLLLLCMFLVPIMYPLENIPERFRPVVELSPPGILTQSYHAIFFHGVFPDWHRLLAVTVFGIILCWLGRRAFEAHKDAFAEYL